MANQVKLNKPWLVAVWPGMGHVAIAAGYYLITKLDMHIVAEFPAHELFEVEHVEVKGGLIRPGQLPRSRFFVWNDPARQHDIVVFIGDAQPPRGRAVFCHRLTEFAKSIGVERVYTFAAMATQMHPDAESRVFVAATDQQILDELKQNSLEVLEDGNIGGLNGVLLGVAAAGGLEGACLLGEMPHIFAQLPYPKASLGVLKAFTEIAGIKLDLTELTAQASEVQEKLGELLAQMERAMEQGDESDADEETPKSEPAEEEGVSFTAEDEKRIERLFEHARQSRSSAYELKRELDRLGVYRDYEDRFLDLFKKRE